MAGEGESEGASKGRAARPAAHKAAAAAAAAPAPVDVEAVARRVGLMKGKLHTVSLTRPNLGPTAPVP